MTPHTPAVAVRPNLLRREVYRWAARLGRAAGVRSVLDIVPGIDVCLSHRWPMGRGPAVTVDRVSMDRTLDVPAGEYDMILCVGVLDRCADPHPVLDLLGTHSHARSIAVLALGPDPDSIACRGLEDVVRLAMVRGFELVGSHVVRRGGPGAWFARGATPGVETLVCLPAARPAKSRVTEAA